MPQSRQKYKIYYEECLLHPEKEWRWIPGFDDRYMVSSCGDVRVHASSGKHGRYRLKSPRIMRLRNQWNGYVIARMQTHLKRSNYAVHRLVLFAFHGAPLPGLEAAHLDGTRDNNHKDNLCWMTHVENMGHRWRHGTQSSPKWRGDVHPWTKVTEENRRAIREAIVHGEHKAVLAKRYGVGTATIRRIELSTP